MDQSNRTFIGSVVFIDIVGYSKKSVSEQITMKDWFTGLLSDSLKDISADQRIILDTGDGAALSFLGDPEDALFVGMNLRDLLKRPAEEGDIAEDATSTGSDLFLRIGINLGPIKLVRDINGQPNIVGDGINVAQRIMSFARPGQVVVSRSYYDVVSVISDEYAQLFKYEGSRTDKHVREHEIYVVGDSAAAFKRAKSGMEGRAAATNPRNKTPAELKAEQKIAAAAAQSQASSPASKRNPAPPAEASNTTGGHATPFLQDKKKLGIVGGALAAVVVLLAVLVATKKPADVPKVDLAAAGSPAPINAVATAPPTAGAGIDTPKAEGSAAALPTDTTAAAKGDSKPESKAASDEKKAAVLGKAEPQKDAKADVKAEPKADTKTDAKASPAAAATGQGTINLAIQPWGEVFVNGKSIGLSPPIKQHKLPAGKHKVEVRNSTFTPLVTTVDVKAREEVNIRHQFN
jgi:class 3 adenylate cyclase